MSASLLRLDLQRLIDAALHEDIGTGDATSLACIPRSSRGAGILVSKGNGVICGVDIAARVFKTLDRNVRITNVLRDGSAVRRGTTLARIEGNMRALLAAERTALNLLQHLSGIATLTSKFVHAARGTGAVILDTRKTTPLIRTLEKRAVRAGGGSNHRFGLDDMILIKDNHIAAAGNLTAAVRQCLMQRSRKRLQIEVETTSLAQVREALAIDGIDRIMLDNFSLPEIRRAVKLIAHRIPVEVSGGVSLKTVRAIARTGADFISVGAITRSAPGLDISFEIRGTN